MVFKNAYCSALGTADVKSLARLTYDLDRVETNKRVKVDHPIERLDSCEPVGNGFNSLQTS